MYSDVGTLIGRVLATNFQTIQIENNTTGSLIQLTSAGILSINSNAQKPGGGGVGRFIRRPH